MFTLLRTLSLGYFGKHLLRSSLVILSIALGVATLVATQALSKGLASGVQDGVNPLGSLAQLLVIKGQHGVPMDLAEAIREEHLEGVDDAQPYVMWRVPIKELDNKSAWLLGVDGKRADGKGSLKPGKDNALGVEIRDIYKPDTLADAAALFVAQPALVSPGLAAELKREDPKNRRFTVRNAGFSPEVTRVGTVDFSKSPLPLRESHVIVMDVRSAAAICFPEKPDHVHQIGITLEPGADPEQVRKRLQAFLGDRADVQTLDASRTIVSDVSAGLEIGLTLGSAVALVVGLFLVYNILSVTVAERRHDVGILRSVGATRPQIAGLFVSEAAVQGLIGSLLGVPLGLFMAWMVCKRMADTISDMLVPIDGARVRVEPWLLLVAVLAGTAVAMLAALVPALQAASEEPADAVRRAPRRGTFTLAVAQVLATLFFLALGVAFAQARKLLPTHVGMYVGVTFLFVGGLISTPVLASLVGRVIQPFFRYFLGLEGRLAADNLVRAPGRSGVVIGALAATVGLLASTAGFIKSTRESIHEWVEDKIAADLFVTSGSSLTSGGSAMQMRDDTGWKLRRVPGVKAAVPVRFMRVDYRNKAGRDVMVFVVGLDTRSFDAVNLSAAGLLVGTGDSPLAAIMAAGCTVDFDWSASDVPMAKSMERNRKLGLGEPGTVIVSENFAALNGVKEGDVIEVPAGKGTVSAKVVGTVTDYTWNRGTIIMDLRWFRQVYNDQQVDVYDVFLKPGADAERVREEIMQRHGDEYVLFAATRPEVNREVSSTLNKIYALAYAQQTIVGLVALLGVVMLFISVLQRKRDLGLLRAVGATRGQILRSVLAEAVLMGMIGAAVGFGIGLLLEWYILDVMIFDESGFQFPMRIPWLEAGVVTASAVALATAAGLWPAYQATTLRIPEAIAYE